MRNETNDPNGRDGARLTRLLDGPSDICDENASWALDLLREAPTHRPRAGERQRVLWGLRRRHAGVRHVWLVRMAATAAALIAATTIAWAGLGGLPRWLTTLAHPHPDKADSRVHAKSEALRRSSPTTPAPAVPLTLESQPIPNAVPTGNLPRPSRRRLASTIEGRDSDSRLVVQALRALRRDGNPGLARTLAGAYLDRHPNGALAEEALALTVEAAVAHHDPDAATLGARYLGRYPKGPFCGLARQASRTAGASSR
jgi:hypothetical protein